VGGLDVRRRRVETKRLGPKVETPGGGAATLVLKGPLSRAAPRALGERACSLLAAHRHERCDCLLVGLDCDLASVDALARLTLAATRHDCELRFLCAPPRLCELLDMLGLARLLRHHGAAEHD